MGPREHDWQETIKSYTCIYGWPQVMDHPSISIHILYVIPSMLSVLSLLLFLTHALADPFSGQVNGMYNTRQFHELLWYSLVDSFLQHNMQTTFVLGPLLRQWPVNSYLGST